MGKVTGVIDINNVKTKCMVMCRDQKAGLSRNIEIGNSSFESVEEFKCLGIS